MKPNTMNKNFIKSNNISQKNDLFDNNKESLQHTASGLSDSTCMNAQLLQSNDLVALKSDKKRPNPWQDDSVCKRFSGLYEDNIETSIKQTSHGSDSLLLFDNGQLSSNIYRQIEEALNHILISVKDLINVNFKEISISQAQNMQSLVEQIISGRLHRLMLGKHVDSYMEVVTVYREQFPLETDQDMLKAAYETIISKPMYIQADSAEKFFELNLEHILNSKLNEIFGKLEEIYSESRGPVRDTDMMRSTMTTFEKNDKQDNKYDNNIQKNYITINRKLSYLEKHDNILENLLRKMLPHLTQIMNLDYAHESKIAKVVLKTANLKASVKASENDNLTQVDTVPKNNKGNTVDEKIISNAGDKTSTASGLYYVKVIGRPSLPIKETMQTFLDQFKPKCVKKHKKQHNLLFLGFTEETDYDHILSKNGVTVGNCVIEIKPNEQTGIKTVEKLTNNNANKTEISKCVNVKTESNSKIISSNINNVKNTEASQILKANSENVDQFNDTISDSILKLNAELDDQLSELMTRIHQGDGQNDIVDANKNPNDDNSEVQIKKEEKETYGS